MGLVTLTGALLGLLLGVGLLLVWRSGPRAPRRTTRSRGPSRRQQQLAAAGLTGINAAQLVALQVGLGLLAFVVVLLTTGTVTVSAGKICWLSRLSRLVNVVRNISWRRISALKLPSRAAR